MYQLEERILFDGAAVAAVATAQQDANKNDAAQKQAHDQNTDKQDQQNQQHDQPNPHTQSSSDITKPNANSATQQHTGVDQLLAQALGLDAGAPAAHKDAAVVEHKVNVMVISTSLENADVIASLADSKTIVIKYDSHTTTSTQLLHEINEALHGEKADSIAFLSESGKGQLSLFKDGKTTVSSLQDSTQQQFWHGVEGMLDSKGRVDFVASNLAATAEGKALVNGISHITGHETAASTDLTGNAAKGGDWNLEYVAGGKNAHQTDLTETYLNRNILDSFTSVVPADTMRHEVAFINSTVKDAETIIKQLGSEVDIVRLDSLNAFEEIQAYLNTHSNVDSIHIFTHGNEGFFKIGSTNVDNSFLDANKNLFASWEKSLTKDADIMIYGCDTAASVEGQTLISRLAAITGADVAASTDTTGRDGNWALEFHVGVIDTSEFLIAGYNYNLANITLTVNSVLDKPVVEPIDISTLTLRQGIHIANNDLANDYTIKFAPFTTLGDDTITMNAALGEYVLKNNITIDGTIDLGSGAFTWVKIDAGNTMRHFSVNAGYNVALDSMELYNGFAPASGGSPNDGGSIYNAGILLSNDVYMHSNFAGNAGGAIFNTGDLTITASGAAFKRQGVDSNTAGAAGGGIYNAKEGSLKVEGLGSIPAYFFNNSTINGSGGAIYSFGKIALNHVALYSNTANHGDGGAVFVTNLVDTSTPDGTHFYYVDMVGNHADGSGGGIYFTLGGNLLVEWSYIDYNTADLYGGGIFFDQSGNLKLATDSSIFTSKNTSAEFIGNTAGKSGGAVYMNNSGSLTVDFVRFEDNRAGLSLSGGSGGAIYANNTTNVTLLDTEIYNNQANAGTADSGFGGGIYYVNTNPGGIFNITNSDISRNIAANGAGIYFTALSGALLDIKNSTLAYNTATGAGGAIWIDNGSLNITFDTLAYNQAISGAAIYMNNTNVTAADISLLNTIVYNTTLNPGFTSQIYLGADVTVTQSQYNIFSHLYTNFYADAAAQSLTNGAKHPVTRTLPNGSELIVAYRDGWNNFVGYANDVDPVDGKTSSQKIQAYLYLNDTLNFAANYRTRVLSLLYKESFAYGAGLTVAGITYDQRGNLRNGYDVNGNVNAAPSIGAFEPIFYLTVTSKGDHSYLFFSQDKYGKHLDETMISDLTLREAIYWLDTYNPSVLPANILTDTNRYVKFSATVFTDNNSTINLTFGQIRIGGSYLGVADTSKQIRISITPDDIWHADNTYVAQNAANRIIVNAGGLSRVFAVVNSSVAIVSNLTLQNGKAANVTDNMNGGAFIAYEGWGGAIYNSANLTLNNVVVKDSITANNVNIGGWWADASRGGGIYNSGTMTINDSTISGNQSISNADSNHPGDNLGLGGGIYNDGTMLIERSIITANAVLGNVTYVDNSVKGGGIYNGGGSLTVVNTTISANTTNSSEALKLDAPTGVAAGAGAAIFVAGGDLTVYYCTIAYNQALLNTAAADVPTDPKTIGSYYSAISMTGSGDFTLSYTIMGQNSARVSATPTALTPWDIFTGPTATVIESGNYNARYNIIPYFNGPADPSSPGFDWNQFNTPGVTLNYTGDAASDNVLYYLSNALAYNGGKTMNYRIYDGSWALTNGSETDHPLYATDQRGNSRSQLDRLGLRRPTIGAYEALTEVYITASGDTGSTPAIQGFDFANDRPGFYADTVTVRDAFFWADPEAVIRVRFADGGGHWTSDTINLAYNQIQANKGVDFYGDVNFYNYVTGTELDPGQKIIIDPSAPNRYSYFVGEEDGKTVYYDNNRGQYYYMLDGGQVWLIYTEVAAAGVTAVPVDYTDAQGKVSTKYVYYTDSTDKQVFQNVLNGKYYYLSDSAGRIALAQVGTTQGFSAADFHAQTINTGRDITVSGNNQYRVFNVDNSQTANVISVAFFNMTLTNGLASAALYPGQAYGGGIYSFENLALTNVNLVNNKADSFGGGIYIQAGNLSISSSIISGNSSLADGGGVFSTGGKVIIQDSSVLSNTAAGVGGGMFVAGATQFDVTGSTFGYNMAGTHGGGIYSDSSNLAILNSTLSENQAAQNGGGIAFTGGGELSLTYVTIANNKCGTSLGTIHFGGGVFLTAGNMTMINSIIAQNLVQKTATTTSYNDFYTTGGAISATYSAVGASVGWDFSTGAGNVVGDPVTGIISNLGLSTKLELNGGTTMTLYLATTSDVAASGTVIGVTTSQNGVDRKSPLNPDSRGKIAPSMGAYESRVSRYVYLGTFYGQITDTAAWGFQDSAGAVSIAVNPTSFNILDATFVFNSYAAGILSVQWNVNSRSNIELSFSNLPLPAGSGSLTINATGKITSTRIGEKVTINVLDQSSLILGTDQLADITLGTVGNATTVTYSFNGNQTILPVASYGHLVLSGGGVKQAGSDLNVMSSLNLNNVTLDINGGLTVVGGGAGTDSTIELTGNLSLSGGTHYDTVALVFDGAATQNVFFDSDQIFTSIIIDNVNGVKMDPLSAADIRVTDFTFVHGAFTLHDNNLVITDGQSGASGIDGRYFVTAGAGTVDLPLTAGGTHFVLAVEDAATPGTYKWTDVVLTPGTATHAAMRLIDGVVKDNGGNPQSAAGSLTVTWDVASANGDFTFSLVDYSGTAAGKYFDRSLSQLHYTFDPSANPWDVVPWDGTQLAGYFYVGHAFGLVKVNADDPANVDSLRWAINQVNLTGSGVIVFDETSVDFINGANVVLSSTYGTLVLNDGVRVNIIGLTDNRPTYIRADGFTVLQTGVDPVTVTPIKLSYLDFRGGGTDYVLINNADLQVTNVSVGANAPSTWQTAPILNNDTLTVRNGSDNTGYIALDGGAAGNEFNYVHDVSAAVTLRYFGGLAGLPAANNGVEFSSSLYNVELVNNAAINIITTQTIGNTLAVDATSQLNIQTDLGVTGDVTVTSGGIMKVDAGNTLSLYGANNQLGGANFNAAAGSTVDYAGGSAQNVDAVTYANLTISGTGLKTAASGFTVNETLSVDAGSQLTLNYASASDTLRVNGDTAVLGTLAFANAGTLALYGNNNNLGTFNYGTSTVAYLGGVDQLVSDVDYYNLEIGGGVVRQTVNFDITVANNFIIDANTTFKMGTNTLLVHGDFTMAPTGAFIFTGGGFLRLEKGVNANFNFTAGTVVYQGAATQQVAPGIYYNLAIDNGDKVLANAVTVNGDFIFENAAGKLLIGGMDITLNGGVTGASGTDGRYFAFTQTVGSGEIIFALAAGQVRPLTIGARNTETLQWSWSTLNFTGSAVPQNISIWTKTGINPAILNPQYAADMTFVVTPRTAGTTYSMDMMATSAGGALFNTTIAVPFYKQGNRWVQVANPLNQTGEFFFGVGIPDIGLVVTNTNDSGSGSLRWAVAAANLLEGINLITFSKDVFISPQTINLTSGEIVITDGVIIKGLGATLITVSGMDQSRIFNITNSAMVSVSGMTLTRGSATVLGGGESGGAITVDGTLQLENVEISNSNALVNGGAIYVSDKGSLYTMKVTVSGSSAQGFGNGIYSEGTLSLYNSTIAYNGTGGTEIYLNKGSAKLFNVTVAARDIAPGVLGTAINVGSGALSMYNTIIYGNVGAYTGSNNFVSLDTVDFDVFEDGILKDNGGWVRTIAIADDIRVVNNGLGYKDGAYQYDSRGYLVNGKNDLGAFEYQGYVARNTSATSNPYYSSVADAIAGAATGDKIELVDTRIKLDSEITITKDITLTGTDRWTTVISRGAGSDSRAFAIGTSGLLKPAVSMLNFAIRDGSAMLANNDKGGAILNYGNLQLRNVLIADNMAVSGGAVYNQVGAFMYADRSSFVDNTALLDGGAIYNFGSLTVKTSQVSGNTAGMSGGGIYNGTSGKINGQLFLLSSTVDHNSALSGAGGGIFTNGKFQAETSTIFMNSASTFGGGIYTDGDSKLISLTIANNSVSSAGGGIYIKGGTVNLVNTIAAYNVYVGGWSDVIDPNNILVHSPSSSVANFIGENVTGFYASGDVLFDGSLKDSGGWTYTLALNTASAYFNSIKGQGIAIGNNFDQRGYMINGSRDIGAYEQNGFVGWYYDKDNGKHYFSDISAGISSVDNGKTLYLVNTRILQKDIEANLEYWPEGGTYPVPKNVTIVGDASGETVISAGQTGRVFYLDASASTGGKGGTLTLKNMTIADGNQIKIFSPLRNPSADAGRGGAIYVSGAQLVLNGVNVINSQVSNDGGAIYIGTKIGAWEVDKFVDVTGSLTATGSFFGNNFAGKNGGAINGEGEVTISSSTIYANTAGLGGGGIAITGAGNVSLTSTTIAYNHAVKGLGGGVLMASLDAKSTLTTANNLLVRNMNSLSYDRDAITSTASITTGTVPPSPALTANAGDYYLDSVNANWYYYNGESWAVTANIFTAYSLVTAGADAPADTAGNNGDYYIMKQSGYNIVYFKDGGTWTAKYQLDADTIVTGTTPPDSTNTSDNRGSDYIDLTNGNVYHGLISGWSTIASWSIKGISHQMLTGVTAPVDLPEAGGYYYMNTVTGELYVSEVGNGGSNLGVWSKVIATMKSSKPVTVGMDYYFLTGKLTDTGYNMVEYQNGVWSKDSANYFGEITWDEKDPKKVTTDKHDILANHGTSPYPTPPFGADPIKQYYDFGNVFMTGVASDNGGWSKTLALSNGSLAVDAGTGVTLDQRGYGVNSASDIGAFEFHGFVASSGGINYSSVQDAVNAAADGATITFNATRILESGIAVNKNLTFTGTSGATYLSGGYADRVIDAEASGGSLTFNTMSIGEGVALDSNVRQGAGAVGNGGAIFSNGSVTMTDVQFFNSFAQRSGGGVYTVGDFSITTTGNFDFQTIFSGNRANESGGAVFSNGIMTVKGVSYSGTASRYINSLVQFVNNSAGQGGGALGIAGVANMQYFYMGNNWAGQGGGLYLTTGLASSTSMIQDFAIDSNFAISGGGMYVNSYSSNIELHDNYNVGEYARVYHTEFDSNTALLDGGAIYSTNSANMLLIGKVGERKSGIDVISNIAGGSGGGIFFNISQNLTLGNYVYVDSNTAGYDGGGIYFANSGQLTTVFSNSVSDNTAGQYGGGIYMLNSAKLTTADHLSVDANTAGLASDNTGRGGAFYLNNVKEVDLYYTNMLFNSAYESGAGMYLENVGKVTMRDVDISYSQGSGGIYAIGASNITMKNSNVNYSDGTGIWVEGGTWNKGVLTNTNTLTLENVTVFANGIDTSPDIGGIYMGNGNFSMKFSTVYMNYGVVGSLLIGDTGTANVSITDSIIFGYGFENYDVSFGTNVRINASYRNILAFYNTYLNASGLVSGAYRDIYDGNGIHAGAIDGRRNIVGYDNIHATQIMNNFVGVAATASTPATPAYFDNVARYHANYRTQAVAITSLNSIAYGYYTNSNRTGFSRSGAADGTVITDQRGNARNGYYYDPTFFDKETNTWGRYILNSAPSIGAFEPIFSLTVNNKGDMTYDPFSTIVESGLAANVTFADALAENNGSLNLRLASYWIDNYMVETQDFNPDRYIKFDAHAFTHTGDNTIKLNPNAGPLEIRTSQIIGMVPNYNGYNFTPDTTSFMAQDSTSRITLDAQGSNRVITVLNNFNYNITVGINNLTLINGLTSRNSLDVDYDWGNGGGIYNDANLTLNNVVISNSKASNQNMVSSYAMGFGGGIYNAYGAVLTINDSSITNNTAEGLRNDDYTSFVGLGGGIFNDGGAITINRSLIANNIATGFTIDLTKEAWKIAGLGGGIYNSSGTLLVENSTITNNTLQTGSTKNTGSAIYVNSGNVTLYNNTIVNNSLPTASMGSDYSVQAAAVYLGGSGHFTLQNNIFALNNANGAAGFRGRDIYYSGSNITESHNIIGNYGQFAITPYTGYDFSSGIGNIIGDSFGNVNNLNLDNTLRYNGGMTMNFRVQNGSVAINAGSTITDVKYDQHDQRGAPRPASSPTIGAYEMLKTVTVYTNADNAVDYSNPNIGYDFTTFDPVTKTYKITNYGGWQTSLRNALFLADGGATVTIDNGTDNKAWNSKTNTIKLAYGQMQIGTSLTLDVKLAGKPVIIDGGWDGKTDTVGSRIFWINSLSTGLVDVSISNLVLQNGSSRADSLGGGAINNSENLTLNNVTIKNSISDNGGAIYSTQGSLTLQGLTVISGNTALNNGGAIYVNAGNLNIIGSESGGVFTFVKITDNHAAALGGGIYASNAAVTMQLAEISLTPTTRPSSTAIIPIHGGGIYLAGSTLNMKQSVIANNKSSYDGAGIYQINGSSYIEASTISSNTAGRYGGGIYAAVSNFEVVNSTISENKSGAFGGGIYYSSTGNLSLTYTTIANNISGTAKNAVEISGGGIYQAAGTVQMINSIVAQNYHISILSTNHDDFYMASGSTSSINSATYSIVGQSNIDFSQGAGMIVLGTVGNTGYNWNDLKLSTIVEDNTGPTKTLFVFSGSVAIGHGVDIPSIQVDQRGITRQNPPTIGAYEKNPSEYIYIGSPTGDVNDLANWKDSSGKSPISFIQPDALFVYNTAVTITSDWTLGSRAGSEVRTGGDVAVAGGVLVTATMSLTGTGFLSISDGGKFSGSMFVKESSALELATADANVAGLVLSVTSTNSTVSYSYTGSQTVFTANYGNLILTGGLPGTNKTATASITVNGNLDMQNVLFTTPSIASLTVLGNVTGNGNISSGSVTLGSATSNIALTGNILSNGSFGNINISGSNVNIAGDLTSLNGSIAIQSQNNAVLDGDISASRGAISVSAINMFYSNGTMSTNAIALINTDSVFENAVLRSPVITALGNISTSGNGTTSSFLTSNLIFDNLANTLMVGSEDTLYFNVGLQSVLMDNGSGTVPAGGLHLNVQNITVDSTGRFKVVTDSNLALENVTGTEADNIKGILSLTSPTLNLSQIASLNFNFASFEFGGNITIGPNDFTINNGVDFIGNVTLNGAAGSTINVNSNNSYVKFTGMVFATGQNLNVSANTGIAFNNITGINDLTAASSSGVITLNGNITASGSAGFMNNVVVTGANTALTADNMNFAGSLSGLGNLTLNATGAAQTVISGGVNMGGTLTLGDGFFTTLNNGLTVGGLTIKAPAELNVNLGVIIVNGSLNNAGILLSNADLHVRGNMINTGALTITSNSSLILDGASLQNLNLGVNTNLENVVLNNVSGAKLVSGNMTILNDFTFQAGKFDMGNSIVEIHNALIGGGMDNYFVAGSKGLLKLMVRSAAAPTDFWIGNADYASKVSIQTQAGDAMFGVSTFNSVPGNGVPGSQVIYGINSAVKRTWVISNAARQDYDIAFAWNKAEEGAALGDVAVLSNYQSNTQNWRAVGGTPITDGGAMRSTGMMSLSVTGAMSVAAPGASYDYPGAFHGLNNTSANLNFGPPPSMVVDVPPSMGLYSFEQMQLRLAESPLGNPLNVMIPATGTDIGGEYANETLTVTSGTSVYGTPDGETEVDTEWMAPVEEREENTIEEELDRQLEDFFTELADSGNLEKHPAFKSEVDILLDKLMAS